MKLKLLEAITTRLPDIDETDGELVARLFRNENYFKNQKLIDSLMAYLPVSVSLYGLDPKNNQLLAFVLDDAVNNSSAKLKNIDANKAKILDQALGKDGLKFGKTDEAIEKWIFDPKAYSGTNYKLTTLITLSTPEQLKRFVRGEKLKPENRPFKAVLEANSDKEIEDILDEYAPENEDEVEDSKLTAKTDKEKEEVKKKIFDYFDKMLDSNKISNDKLNEIIDKVLKTTTKWKDVLSSVIPLIAKEVGAKIE